MVNMARLRYYAKHQWRVRFFCTPGSTIYELNRHWSIIFDAHEHFGASVDACLLFVRSNPIGKSKECSVFRSFHAQKPDTAFGLQDGRIVANVKLYQKWKMLAGINLNCWRLGIKHDCSKVFESRVEHRNLVNKECDTARMLAERQMVEYTAGLHQRLLFREETADYGSEPVRNIVSWKV